MNAGAVEQHFEIASRFYAPTEETYIGMARLYAEDAAMRKFHNGYHPRMVETEHIGAACHHDDVRYPVTEHEPGPRVSFAVTRTDFLGGHGFDVMEEGGSLPPPPHAASAPQPLDAILWPLMVRSVRGSILKDLLDNRLVS